MRVPARRNLPALPYAHRFEPFTGDLEREEVYEWLHIDKRSWTACCATLTSPARP